VVPLEMKEGTTSLGAREQSAIYRAAVLYKPRLATFNFKKRGKLCKKVTKGISRKNIYLVLLKGK
jgi:hypothetical protein